MAVVSVDTPTTEEAAGDELSPVDRIVPTTNNNMNQEIAAVPARVSTTSRPSGGRGGNGDNLVSPVLIALLLHHWWRCYDDLQAQRRRPDYDLEAGGGGQAHRLAAARVHEPSQVAIAKTLQGIMVQAYAAFLPACVTAYPLLKDAPDHVKFTIFGGLAFITIGLFVGIVSRSVPRRGLTIRLARLLLGYRGLGVQRRVSALFTSLYRSRCTCWTRAEFDRNAAAVLILIKITGRLDKS